MVQRAAQLGLVLCLGLVILAWGTSPCLFASMLSGPGGCGAAAEGCGCGCCSDPDAEPRDRPGSGTVPTSGTDGCPVCSSIGNMHELPPVGAKVCLDSPPPSTLLLPPVIAAASATPSTHVRSGEVVLEPPRVQFCTTVALLR